MIWHFIIFWSNQRRTATSDTNMLPCSLFIDCFVVVVVVQFTFYGSEWMLFSTQYDVSRPWNTILWTYHVYTSPSGHHPFSISYKDFGQRKEVFAQLFTLIQRYNRKAIIENRTLNILSSSTASTYHRSISCTFWNMFCDITVPATWFINRINLRYCLLN